jgi:hypothetical protein
MRDFAAAVSCIDGRYHEPLVAWIRDRFEVRHVDLVTAPGVSSALARGTPEVVVEVSNHLAPSLEAHQAGVVVVAAHEGCAADPSDARTQLDALPAAVSALRTRIGADRRLLGVRVHADGTVTVAVDQPPTDARSSARVVEDASS